MTREVVRKNPLRASFTLLAAALLAATALFAQSAAAQTGAVSGTVISAQTGEPLSAAQVSIEGTGLGSLTQSNGKFLILRVPPGTYRVSAILIGFASTTAQVTVTAGSTAVADMRMAPQAIALSEIVVTGVAGATQRTKLPFEVAQVRAADLQVPNVNVGSTLTGKVSGVQVVSGSGRPGSAPSILLRGVKSLNASGRDQEPLYIVDGVILGSTLVDLDALDIQSIEVVKGAAAASLYGSRAANGVIQVRTRRGTALADDQIAYTLRSEYGRSELGSVPELLLTKTHQYMLVNGQFVNTDGTKCDWLLCKSPTLAGQNAAAGQSASTWNTVMNVPWPGQTFNQVERFFQTGQFMQNYMSAEGRSGRTNFHISLSNMQDEGVMPGMDGFDRTNLRVNVDQAMNEKLQVQASAFYSRSDQGQFPESQGNPLFDLTRMPAGVDLTADDPNLPGELVLDVDPTNNESPNPLYQMYNRKYTEGRGRFLGSSNVRFSPFDWMDLDVNGSYDRSDRDVSDYYPKGYRTIIPSASLNNGQLYKFRSQNEALNASITATLRHNFTDQIRNRTQFRYLYETQDYESVNSDGYEFAVKDVPTLDNINQDNLTAGSYSQTVRADGYFAITNFDLYDKYVVDALIRNDGSSLFGADERRQWYYRFAGAWRLTQEPFFDVPGINELKLRYSYGTAGGRPNFTAQYETYSVSGGRVSPVTLGNKNLKPEFSAEQEIGLDAAVLNNRVSLGLTYAFSDTKDQILPVPQPAYTGYQTQWRNAGTIESKTFEATLDVQILQREDFSWSAKLLFDKSTSTITELSVPPFTYGVEGQEMGTIFYARPGEKVGTFYGNRYAQSCADLPTGVNCDGFAVNDQGWLVWVGSGGFATPKWGTDSDAAVRGSKVKWGTPFLGECTDRSTDLRTLYCPVGKGLPDYNINLSQTFTYKGVNVYALVSRSVGFDVYNQPLQWAVFKNYAGIIDQSTVPTAEQKPIGYFEALYTASGLRPSNAFVEDASFTKLREVSASYRFTGDQLAAVPGLARLSGLGITMSGRNLLTWTDYRGFDPETGRGGGDTGSAAIARVEGYQYPNFRTFTAAIELIF
ncbi:MAG TPA: SusC/RagA family TonB-linked outer membrane protein [Longimicrobiales bacterium]|nr:SusC/RagA family TonB-linked outer membrane protein [Longimicrobiales bacterium]